MLCIWNTETITYLALGFLISGLCAHYGEPPSSLDDTHEIKAGKITNKLQLIAKIFTYPETFKQTVA